MSARFVLIADPSVLEYDILIPPLLLLGGPGARRLFLVLGRFHQNPSKRAGRKRVLTGFSGSSSNRAFTIAFGIAIALANAITNAIAIDCDPMQPFRNEETNEWH